MLRRFRTYTTPRPFLFHRPSSGSAKDTSTNSAKAGAAYYAAQIKPLLPATPTPTHLVAHRLQWPRHRARCGKLLQFLKRHGAVVTAVPGSTVSLVSAPRHGATEEAECGGSLAASAVDAAEKSVAAAADGVALTTLAQTLGLQGAGPDAYWLYQALAARGVAFRYQHSQTVTAVAGADRSVDGALRPMTTTPHPPAAIHSPTSTTTRKSSKKGSVSGKTPGPVKGASAVVGNGSTGSVAQAVLSHMPPCPVPVSLLAHELQWSAKHRGRHGRLVSFLRRLDQVGLATVPGTTVVLATRDAAVAPPQTDPEIDESAVMALLAAAPGGVPLQQLQSTVSGPSIVGLYAAAAQLPDVRVSFHHSCTVLLHAAATAPDDARDFSQCSTAEGAQDTGGPPETPPNTGTPEQEDVSPAGDTADSTVEPEALMCGDGAAAPAADPLPEAPSESESELPAAEPDTTHEPDHEALVADLFADTTTLATASAPAPLLSDALPKASVLDTPAPAVPSTAGAPEGPAAVDGTAGGGAFPPMPANTFALRVLPHVPPHGSVPIPVLDLGRTLRWYGPAKPLRRYGPLPYVLAQFPAIVAVTAAGVVQREAKQKGLPHAPVTAELGLTATQAVAEAVARAVAYVPNTPTAVADLCLPAEVAAALGPDAVALRTDSAVVVGDGCVHRAVPSSLPPMPVAEFMALAAGHVPSVGIALRTLCRRLSWETHLAAHGPLLNSVVAHGVLAVRRLPSGAASIHWAAADGAAAPPQHAALIRRAVAGDPAPRGHAARCFNAAAPPPVATVAERALAVVSEDGPCPVAALAARVGVPSTELTMAVDAVGAAVGLRQFTVTARSTVIAAAPVLGAADAHERSPWVREWTLGDVEACVAPAWCVSDNTEAATRDTVVWPWRRVIVSLPTVAKAVKEWRHVRLRSAPDSTAPTVPASIPPAATPPTPSGGRFRRRSSLAAPAPTSTVPDVPAQQPGPGCTVAGAVREAMVGATARQRALEEDVVGLQQALLRAEADAAVERELRLAAEAQAAQRAAALELWARDLALADQAQEGGHPSGPEATAAA